VHLDLDINVIYNTVTKMLLNPFTPTEIASLPDDFYGRADELVILERSLQLGSVVIHGPMGIGNPR
jgi:hypothetical protein